MQIEHRSLTNYVLACVHYLSMSEATVQLNFFGVAFDGSVLATYPPLVLGAKLVLRSRDLARSVEKNLRESFAVFASASATRMDKFYAAHRNISGNEAIGLVDLGRQMRKLAKHFETEWAKSHFFLPLAMAILLLEVQLLA